MGYELDKLMKQFGVSTPGAVGSTGAAGPEYVAIPGVETPNCCINLLSS